MENTENALKALEQISTSTIYLMGGSFMLGCFFTLFILLVLDFIRRKSVGGNA